MFTIFLNDDNILLLFWVIIVLCIHVCEQIHERNTDQTDNHDFLC